MANKHKYRPAIRSHKDLTTIERILVHISDDPERPTIRLSPKEHEKLKRVLHAHKLMVNNNTMYQAAKKMMIAFPGMSRASAYRDLRDSKLIFDDLEKATKEQERHILIARIIRGAKIAFDKKDMDAYVKFLALEAKVRGMDRYDPELPNFEDIEEMEIRLGYYPDMMNVDPNPETAADKFIKNLQSSAEDAQIIPDAGDVQENTPE